MTAKNKKMAGGVILISLIFISIVIFNNKKDEEIKDNGERTSIVSVIKIGEETNEQEYIETIGSVKADTKIPVVALQSGTVSSINFEIGDKIGAGQILARIKNNSLITNLVNAQTDFSSRSHNMEVVKTSTEQDIQAAEIGLQNAENSLELAEIQLNNAENNYENGLIQIEKNKEDLKINSVINFQNNIAFLFENLDKINYIIKAEGNEQLTGIENVIAAKNKQSLSISKSSYLEAKTCYKKMLQEDTSPERVLVLTKESINCLNKLNIALDDVIVVLDSTISSSDFSEATLNGEINKFNQIRVASLSSLSATKSISQSLENIEINSKTEKDRLNNNLEVARNQLNLAKIAYENALLNVEKTKSLKEQQLISSQIAKDSSLGQLNLVRDSASDLTLRSSISGTITKKSIEIGEEVSPGKIVAEVSRLDLVKVTASLSSQDAYSIKVGDLVIIEDGLEGFVSQINPIADDQSKKVAIEIAYDNKNNDLIVETFVNLKIPIEKNIFSEEGHFLIPLKAVSITQNENFVFVVKDNIAVKTDVEIGDVSSSLVEIKKGLEVGDQLIIEGNKGLNDSTPVEIK